MTDPDILAVLQSIRTIALVAVGAAITSVGLNSVRVWLGIRTHFEIAKNRAFQLMCQDYFDAGNLEALVEHCQDRLSTRPNDGYALWYLAKAHFATKNFDRARQTLQKDDERFAVGG